MDHCQVKDRGQEIAVEGREIAYHPSLSIFYHTTLTPTPITLFVLDLAFEISILKLCICLFTLGTRPRISAKSCRAQNERPFSNRSDTNHTYVMYGFEIL